MRTYIPLVVFLWTIALGDLSAQTAWRVTQLLDKPAGRACFRDGQLYAVQTGSRMRLPGFGMQDVLHAVHLWDGAQWRSISLPELGYPSDTLEHPAFSQRSFWAPIVADQDGNVYVAGTALVPPGKRNYDSRVMVFRVAAQRWVTFRYTPPTPSPLEDTLQMTRLYHWLGIAGDGTVYLTASSYRYDWLGDSLNNAVRLKDMYTELFRVSQDGLTLLRRWSWMNNQTEEATPFVGDGSGGLYFVSGNRIIHITTDGSIEDRLLQSPAGLMFDRSARILARTNSGELYLVCYTGTARLQIARIDVTRATLHLQTPTIQLYRTTNDPNYMIIMQGIGLGFWTDGVTFSLNNGGFEILTGTLGDTAITRERVVQVGGPVNVWEVQWISPDKFIVGWTYGLTLVERTVLSVGDEEQSSLMVYPNPVRGSNGASIGGTITEGSRCVIVDMLGRIVAEMTLGMPPFVLPTEGLSAGTYTLVVQSPQGQVQTTRFVVVD